MIPQSSPAAIFKIPGSLPIGQNSLVGGWTNSHLKIMLIQQMGPPSFPEFGMKELKTYPPWKLTYPLKIDGWKTKFPFKMVPIQVTCQFLWVYVGPPPRPVKQHQHPIADTCNCFRLWLRGAQCCPARFSFIVSRLAGTVFSCATRLHDHRLPSSNCYSICKVKSEVVTVMPRLYHTSTIRNITSSTYYLQLPNQNH